MNRQNIQNKIPKIARQAINEKNYVNSIDILLGLGWLSADGLQDWREGRVNYLERICHANLNKISFALQYFRKWALDNHLKPSLTAYKRKTKNAKEDLRFSKTGNKNIENFYKSHYVSPALRAIKQKKFEEKHSIRIETID